MHEAIQGLAQHLVREGVPIKSSLLELKPGDLTEVEMETVFDALLGELGRMEHG